VLNLSLLAATFGVVFLAELPDKSLFASLVLGTRYPARWVWIGVSAAFAVHVVIAVAAGGVLDLLPHTLVEVIVAILFAAGAALLLLRTEDEAEDAGEVEAAAVDARLVTTHSPGRVMATCFAVVFVGEWGDITQIAIANLTAKYHDPYAVGIGALLALSAVAGLAIKAGNTLLKKVSVAVVRRVAGSVLALFAVVTVVELLT
jgi:putative Ca2+/H+ antiporter (TMEM165/GDT1 family)